MKKILRQGGARSLSKNVDLLGQFTKKIIQLKPFKMPGNTEQGRGG